MSRIKNQFNNFAIFFLSLSPSDSTAGDDLSSISADESVELTRAKRLIFETLVDWSER